MQLNLPSVNLTRIATKGELSVFEGNVTVRITMWATENQNAIVSICIYMVEKAENKS